jgi:hypothetical protein
MTFSGTVINFAGLSYIPGIVSMGSICCTSHINSSWDCCNYSVITLNPMACATAYKHSPMCDWVHAYPKATILCCSNPTIATDKNHPPMWVVSIDFRRVWGWLYYNNQQNSEGPSNNCCSNWIVHHRVHFTSVITFIVPRILGVSWNKEFTPKAVVQYNPKAESSKFWPPPLQAPSADQTFQAGGTVDCCTNQVSCDFLLKVDISTLSILSNMFYSMRLKWMHMLPARLNRFMQEGP